MPIQKLTLYLGLVLGATFFFFGILLIINPPDSMEGSMIPPAALGAFSTVYGAFRFFYSLKKVQKSNEN
jgi:hypothetical protein